MTRREPQSEEGRRIITAIDAGMTDFKALADAVNALPDPQEAFDIATYLQEHHDTLRGHAADLRAQQVRRIWASQEMTLAELGDKLGGLTKQRAGKILRESQAPRPPRTRTIRGSRKEPTP
jgi:hypothetical protein